MDDYPNSLLRYWMMEEEDDDIDFLFDDDEAEAATFNLLAEAESSHTRHRSDAPPKVIRPRDLPSGHKRIKADYFVPNPVYNDKQFRRRMDPNQSNEGSQGAFPGGNFPPYQAVWNPYMYGYQGPPSWFPQGLQQLPPNGPMMPPSMGVPQVFPMMPKWQDSKTRSFTKSAGSDGDGTINLGDDNGSQAAGAEERPTGRDSAKAPKKKGNSNAGSTSSAEHASRMQDLSLQKIHIVQEESQRKNDRFQQMLECEQEKIRIMREKHDMERQEKEKQDDERILGIDLVACTPALRMYYQALHEEIMEKIAARRSKRQGP